MRLISFFIFFSSLSIAAYSQKHYKCNVDSIAVRVSAGSGSDIFYISTPYYDCPEGYVYIHKGFVFMSRDVVDEGYTKIYNLYNTLCWDEGWIPTGSFTPAKRCNICKGKGVSKNVCMECGGYGDWKCCQYKGKEICKRCKGIGYY